MKHVLIIGAIMLFASCNNEEQRSQQVAVPEPATDQARPKDKLQQLGIRYDGHYREQVQDVVYLIRFFPKGNAVLINGMADVAKELPAYLKADATGDPVMGWYNVPVTVAGDSIYFKTHPEKGEISYRGNVPSTSMVRLLRHSHINGTRSIKEYIFQPDTTLRQ